MDEFQVWNLNLDRTKSITAGGGSDQNKGKFISTALMKRVTSFLPQYLDSLPSGDEGVGAGWFFTRAVEWGIAAPLLVQPVLHYSVIMSCSRTKTHWKTCPGIATTQKFCSTSVPLCSCLDGWHPWRWPANLMSLCLLLYLKIYRRPLFPLTQNKQIVY